MAMTKNEKILKMWLIRTLRGQGYKTYSDILKELDLRIDERPDIAAYMDPRTGEITLGAHVIGKNKEEFGRIASTLVRHEILHGFLKHEKRLIDKIKQMHPNEDSLADYMQQYHQSANIAGDYEISNRGYTNADKDIVRNINLNGQIVSGLVTEDQHPDWVDVPFEDLFDKVIDDIKKNPPPPSPEDEEDEIVLGSFEDDVTFYGENGVTYGV